jgi:hypothetical protein
MSSNDTPDVQQATDALMASLSKNRSRRALLRGAMAGTTGVALAGAGLASALPALAAPATQRTSSGATGDTVAEILSIAATAEQLAITLYNNGISNHARLRIYGDNLIYLKAAVIEEQTHRDFFVANGGTPLAHVFSFPAGDATFESLSLFIETQQQLEGAFDSAFLAAVKEFAAMRSATTDELAQIAAQIACVEAEHRVLGRVILGLNPANNWVFEPVLLDTVGQAPGVLKAAGYLSPSGDNTYQYERTTVHVAGIQNFTPSSKMGPPAVTFRDRDN